MWFREGDRLTWNGRPGVALSVVRYANGPGYVRLLLDGVLLPYWVEFGYLERAA